MTLEIKTILAPTDFSETSEEAVEVAVEFARRFSAEIVLFHVYQLPAYVFPDGLMPVAPELLQEVERSIASELDRLTVRIAARGVQVSHATSMGPTHTEIVRKAETIKADLVVMGTHGRSGISHALMGSVAEKVVRKAPCPVLTVRPARQPEEHPIA
jgi:nucleotide-binding universal stress UspA family protein